MTSRNYPKHLVISACTIAAALIIISGICSELTAAGKIAVIKSRFDNIELVLDTYHVDYDLLNFRELVRDDLFGKYDAIFFPSGILSEYEDNLEINWRGKEFTSVGLSKDFFELNGDDFRQKFKAYTKNGGSSYFSGYSFKQLSYAYDRFHFFDDFPYMGVPGRVEADIEGDLAKFLLKKKTALYLEYTGWIALKKVSGAEVLSSGVFETPRGEKSGPISVIIHDKGEILYTSYYSSVYSEFKRFNIFRIAGSHLRKEALETVNSHFQRPTGIILDSFTGKEPVRTYYFDLKEGNNTIYFISDDARYMFEIYNSNMDLIVSKDSQQRIQSYNIISLREDYCFVKVYPSENGRFIMHSVVSAHGAAIPAGVTRAVKIIIIIFGVILLAAFLKVAISRLR